MANSHHCNTPNLTQQALRALLHYDPATGVFTWRHRADVPPEWNTRRAGKVAGSPSHGYIRIGLRGREFQAHRLAWLYMHGWLPTDGREIDHANRNKADNRISNLRVVSRAENVVNSGVRCNNRSGCTGVTWDRCRGAWLVQITANRRTRHVGYFRSIRAARKARRDAEQRFYPGVIHDHG